MGRSPSSASGGAGDRAGVEAHQAQLAGELGAEAREEEPRRARVLVTSVHERGPSFVEHAQVADKRLETPAVAGRRDDRVGLGA